MSYKTVLTFIFLFLSVVNILGQNKLLLESKQGKRKYIDLEREYYIKTSEATYYNAIIVDFNDTTISIKTWINIGNDTTIFYSDKINKTKDTTYLYTQSNDMQYITTIAFKDIQAIEKDWINRRYLSFFLVPAAGAVVNVIFLPIAAIFKGIKGIKDWLFNEAIFIGLSAPLLLVKLKIKKKYDLKNKWTLKTGK